MVVFIQAHFTLHHTVLAKNRLFTLEETKKIIIPEFKNYSGLLEKLP